MSKVARVHERVVNARQAFLPKRSSRRVSENQAIVTEDLSVQGLARTRLAQSVHDAGWGELVRQVAYKSQWQQLDRFFPSSRWHAACGTRNTLSLADRTFACQGCGETLDRDLNAARTIQQQALVTLLAAGQTASPTFVGASG